MAKKSILITGLALFVFPAVSALAQISIEPPAVTTAPATAPATPTAATQASTLPSAQSILDQLKMNQPAGTDTVPLETMVKTDASSTATPPIDAVAPTAPASPPIREGRYIWHRRGRLVRDDKTDSWVFVFDADGKQMTDAPMGLVPSHLLELMETASENGTKDVKFDVSGEVTLYRNKNYLYVREALVPKDLNKGIGG